MSYILALKIGHQNIQGGGKTKLCHDDLVKKVKNHHLFGAQESKLGKNIAAPDIEGYIKFRSDKTKKRPKRVRRFYYLRKTLSGQRRQTSLQKK